MAVAARVPLPRSDAAALVVIVAYFVVAAALLLFPGVRSSALYYPIAMLLGFYVIASVVARSWNPFIITVGADGQLSTSKFQFFAWTGVVVFTYVWFIATRELLGENAALDKVPPNLIYAMGFSIITLAGAKGITSALTSMQRMSKPQHDVTGSPTELVTNDDGQTPSLSKIQMLLWTFVAIGIYLVRVGHSVAGASIGHTDSLAQLPDIDAPLMALMGLGQAAYLGNKLTTSNVPVITSLNPSSGTPPLGITVNGTQLDGMLTPVCTCGTEQYVGNPVTVAPGATSVQFTLPATIGAHAVAAGDRIDIGVTVDGISSTNTLPFIAG